MHLGPFLVAAPAVTASFAGPWMTGFVGLVAVLAQVVVAAARTSLTDLNHTFQIIALVMISVFVTFFAHLREVHEKELTQLRSVAETAQEVVLRPLPDRIGPLGVASVYLAAAAEAQIGGDLYAAARTATGTRLIIGDVRGKGLEAVGDAALVLGAFRASAHQVAGLPGLVDYLEAAVSADLDGAGDEGESFVTAAVLEIPDAEPVLHLVSCGHPRRCSCCAKAAPNSWRRTGRRHRWGSPASSRRRSPRRPSPSPRVTSCSSTPTASWRPATGRAGSTRWRDA